MRCRPGSGQHPFGQGVQAPIAADQAGRFPPGQGQIETVVDRMVQVAGERQGLGQQLLRVEIVEPICPLEFPEGVGQLGEHQLRSQHQRGPTDPLGQIRGVGVSQDQPTAAEASSTQARAISARGRRGSDPPVSDPRSGQE